LSIAGGSYQLARPPVDAAVQPGTGRAYGERTRIARELHDTLLQSFQAVLLHVQAAINLLPGRPDEARDRFERVLEQAARAVTEGRDAVQALRESAGPSEDLPEALSALAEQLAGDADRGPAATIRINVEGSPRRLRPIVRDDVHRIASEAMRNAMRHAQARQIQVDIHYDQRCLQLRIRDDGTGIDAAILEDRSVSGHWGLPGMRERAELIGGTLAVRSRLGAGTEVELSLPASKAYAATGGPAPFRVTEA
jgi:signal transduction histidine kinase